MSRVPGTQFAGITGTEGEDRLNGTNTADTIYGLGGDDYIWGFNGDDYIDGGDGNDNLRDGEGNDTVLGGAGDDTFGAWAGNDLLRGGYGDDLFYGYNGEGVDRIWGEAGFDTMSYFGASSAVVIDADSGEGYGAAAGDTYTGIEKFVGTAHGDYMIAYDDSNTAQLSTGSTLEGGGDVDILYGRSDNDTLRGGLDADDLDGFGGNDQLMGDEGNDQLAGGTGNDLIVGGTGNDHLTGGTGRDTFVFTNSSGRDYVKDFQTNTDKIDLSGYVTSVDNPFGADGIPATGTHITRAQNLGFHDKFFYNTGEDILYKIDMVRGAPAQMTAVVKFWDNVNLLTTDFIL